MVRTTEYLDPQRKPLDAVADWLRARARPDAAGTPSLAHLLVIVPPALLLMRLPPPYTFTVPNVEVDLSLDVSPWL